MFSNNDERFGSNGDDLIASDNARKRSKTKVIPNKINPHQDTCQQTLPTSTET
jgi:hypothetical protein